MRSSFRRSNRTGATLAEVLVAVAVLLVILVAALEFCTQVERSWRAGSADPFADAQDAFDAVTKNLAAATMEPYRDYADSSGNFRTGAAFTPDHLARRSDLDFVCGPAGGTTGLLTFSQRTTMGDAVFFVAPEGETQTYAHTGMQRLLNAIGYFIEFGDDASTPGFILPQSHRYRWRLKQVLQPSESLQVFATANAANSSAAWIQQLAPAGATPTLADNVIALVVLPEASHDDATLAPSFAYDARNTTNATTLFQAPPCLRVALVAIDTMSAERLAAADGANAPALVSPTLFQQAAQLDTDLTALDATLTAQKIRHRILQRELVLPATAWNTVSR
jgi:uncharacterized protein (TIGR02599 family)